MKRSEKVLKIDEITKITRAETTTPAKKIENKRYAYDNFFKPKIRTLQKTGADQILTFDLMHSRATVRLEQLCA